MAVNMPPKVRKYFASERKKAVSVVANDDFSLDITFDNSQVRRYDMSDILSNPGVFAPICSIGDFKRVYVDSCGCIAWDIDPLVDSDLVWSNKLDLCPDSCYIDSVPLPDGGRKNK